MTEQTTKVFASGLIFKPKSFKAPSFIVGHLSFNVEQFIEFLREHDNKGWVNVDIKMSKGGKGYGELNTYKFKSNAIDVDEQ